MRKQNKRQLLIAISMLATVATSAHANTLLSWNASDGSVPGDAPYNWTGSGFPMINIGNSYALQDWTFDSTNQSGEYYTPVGGLPAGTFKRGGPAYGIEFKVRPLNDVAFIASAWPELYLSWTDDVNNYNITIDQFGGSNTSGTGDIVYGRGSFTPAITGIDWSTAHTIFIGQRPSGAESVFDFYLDGVLKSTRTDGSVGRDRAGWASFTDRITFGDGTTGGAGSSDVAAEWYSVSVYDTNVPVVPPTVWNVNSGGTFGTASNWTAGVPNSLAGISTASFGSKITSAATITLATSHTVGALIFDNANRYTLAGSGTLGFSFPGTASIQVINGNHTISAPVNFTSALNVTVADSNVLTINSSSITSGPGATLIKSGTGKLELTHLRGHRLQVDAGTVKMLAGTNNSSAGASKVTDLVIAGGATPTATLDLTNNAFQINYTGASPESTIRDQIKAGFNAGDWQGIGIISSSSATASATSTKTAIAYAEATEVFTTFPATFAGQSVDDNTTLLMKYTLMGDANLDEKVNTLDFNELAGGFGSGTVWTSGDFNYDGLIDSGDFSTLVANFGKTLPAASPTLGAVAPEPMSLSIIALSTLMLTRKRNN